MKTPMFQNMKTKHSVLIWLLVPRLSFKVVERKMMMIWIVYTLPSSYTLSPIYLYFESTRKQ